MMRLASIAAIGVFTIATAAFAQVARGPVEQKNAPANTAGVNATTADPMGNEAMANAAPATNAATPPDAKTEPATPPR